MNSFSHSKSLTLPFHEVQCKVNIQILPIFIVEVFSLFRILDSYHYVIIREMFFSNVFSRILNFYLDRIEQCKYDLQIALKKVELLLRESSYKVTDMPLNRRREKNFRKNHLWRLSLSNLLNNWPGDSWFKEPISNISFWFLVIFNVFPFEIEYSNQ
jgi:hypothetical protein